MAGREEGGGGGRQRGVKESQTFAARLHCLGDTLTSELVIE